MPDFEDPFKSPESTVLRPRPGAGKRGAGDAPPRPAAGASPADVAPPVSVESLGIGLSSLVRAATPLLLLTGQLRGTLNGPDIPTLRRHALDEIRRFEDRARAAGVQNEVMLAARYAICAGLDEAVLSTPWGNQSEWAQQSLLIALHREAYGGEKFFDMLDRISADPKRHIDLMELQYLCLAFGFEGKYHVVDRGQSRLADIQHDLYRRIRDYRGAPPADLSLRWKGLEDRRNPLIKYVPWWVVGAGSLALLTICFVVYRTLLASAASPVYSALSNVGKEAWTMAAPAPAGGPTLKALLANEPKVNVREEGGLSIVTPLVSDLFDSGSATVNAPYIPLLNEIADALKQLPGRVLVVGHTDDRPLRSFRFPGGNDDLSRERAKSVVAILSRAVDGSTIESAGASDREPLYLPASDPANRDKNRRVEIKHVRR